MLHYSCDRCYKILDAEEDVRYTVRIEVQASVDSCNHAEQDDPNHLLELHEIIDRLESDDDEQFSQQLRKTQKHDLCTACYHAYMKNPLNQETNSKPNLNLNFSRN